MQAPFLQVQRFPHFVLAIMKASELDMQSTMAFDMKEIRKALTVFREMADTSLKLASVVRELPSSMQVPVDGATIDPNAPVWFHGLLNKAQSEEIMQGQPHGTFLIRQRPGAKPATPFALALVVHNGTTGAMYTTHHAIRRERNGIFVVRGMNFGEVMSLSDLVDTLRIPRAEWPVRLRSYTPRENASAEQLENEDTRVGLLLAAANVDPFEPDADSTQFAEEAPAAATAVAPEPEFTIVAVTDEGGRIGFEFVGPADAAEVTEGSYITNTERPSNTAGTARRGCKILAINNVDVSGLVQAELDQQLSNVGPNAEIQLVLQFDPEGFAVYDQGVLLKDLGGGNDDAAPKSTTPILREIGQLCLAPFADEDGTIGMYKATIKNIEFGSQADVEFEGYGNRETVVLKKLEFFDEEKEKRLLAEQAAKDQAARELAEREAQEAREAEEAAAALAAAEKAAAEAEEAAKKAAEREAEIAKGPQEGVEVVESLEKPLGMSFDGSKKAGLYITKLKEGGAAEGNKMIHPQMKILKINGDSAEGMNKKAVTEMVKNAEGTVELTLVYH